MLIAAALVGGLTGYYFGIRAGAIAAAVSAFLFVLAMFMPGYAVAFYGIVIVAVVAICFIGPKVAKPNEARTAVMWARKGIVKAYRAIDKLKNR
jgi:hypothetical protein